MSLRHNHIRNITASLPTEVWKGVLVELLLQQVTGENLQYHTARGDDVRPDICPQRFWKASQAGIFDVRVFNPNTTRYVKLELSKSHEINEKKEKKYYNERIVHIEHGRFTALIISAAVGISRECRKFYTRLSEMVSEKRDVNYSTIVKLIRRKITFALIKLIGLCTRESFYNN